MINRMMPVSAVLSHAPGGIRTFVQPPTPVCVLLLPQPPSVKGLKSD